MSSTDTLTVLPPWKQQHGFGLGVNCFPFSTLYRQEMISSFRLFTECQHRPITSCFFLLSTASCAKGNSTTLAPWGTHHQTSIAVLRRKAVGLMGTGILIIILCIPGEAFIWRFQRIYLFPASHIMHKPYNTIDGLGSCTVFQLAESLGEQTPHHVNQRHLCLKPLGSQLYGEPRYFLWAMQFLTIRTKNLDH